ncbi:MAG: cell division protein PerM, partial [Propionibacteriaceae bacterium]
RDQRGPGRARGPVVHWLLASVVGGVAAAVFGWILCAGLAVVGWLGGDDAALADALGIGTQVWLLAHGGGAHIGIFRWTLVPLGFTLVLAAMLSGFASYAARQGQAAAPAALGPGDRLHLLRRVVLASAGPYVAAATVAALLMGNTGQAFRTLFGAGLLAVVATGWGASRALGHRFSHHLPAWARPLPGALLGAQGVMALVGAGVLATSIAVRADRVTGLAEGLAPGIAGGLVLFLAQLVFLPNLIAWSAAWSLGSGFTIGDGSVVSPGDTDLGLVPGIPILGALPPEGAGGWIDLAWLGAGVAAGAVAAVLVMRGRPRARFDETCLVGGLAGVLSGLLFTGLAALTRGDLGTGRLTELGPRLLESGVMAVTLMGLSGMVVGLVWGLVRRPRPDLDAELTTILRGADREKTVVLNRD